MAKSPVKITWHTEMRKLEDLKPFQNNPRTMTKDQAQQLATSFGKFGYVEIIAINKDNTILAGHMRVQTMKDKGWDTCEVRVPSRMLTEDECKEYLIRSNKNVGEWDYDLLANEWNLSDLVDWGFTAEELNLDVTEIEPIEPDNEILEPPKNPKTKLGDVYDLDSHRLICGDSASPDTVASLLEKETPILMLTDPPYNLASENNIHAQNTNNKMAKKLKESSWDKNFDITKFLDSSLSWLPKNISVYIFTSPHLAGDIWKWMKEWSSHHNYCIWKKINPMPSLSKRHWTHASELCCYATRGKHVFNFPEKGHAHNVWDFTKVASCDLHPTMKPIELISHIINHASNGKDVVCDMFLGSGTTLIACEMLNRKCFGIELDPAYCDIIVDRWIKYRNKLSKDVIVKLNGRQIKW